MMLEEHSYPKNMMVQSSLLPFFCIPFWKHKENRAQQNKKLMEFTMPLPNGIIISRDQILQYEMITYHSTNSLMTKMQITRPIDGDWS